MEITAIDDNQLAEHLRLIWLNSSAEERAINLLGLVRILAEKTGRPALAYGAGDFYDAEIRAQDMGWVA